MPKVEIRAADYHVSALSTPDDPFGLKATEGRDLRGPEEWPSRLNYLHVGWQKRPLSMVEIATVDPTAAHWLFSEIEAVLRTPEPVDPADPVYRLRDTVPASEVAAAISKTRGSLIPSWGMFMTLDRDGCNDAIRGIRRARDDAFGRDQ